MRKIKDSKLGFEVGSGLKKSQSRYSYKGICKLYGVKETKMSNEKLMDDLNILLAQTAEMETEAKKELLDERKKGYSGSVAYGKAKACDLFIRGLVEILYGA